MKERLVSALGDVVELLLSCGLQSRADWFSLRLGVIRSSATSPEQLKITVREIRGIVAGMGSFTDLSLVPLKETGLTKDWARKKQWELADELDEVTGALLAVN